MAEQDTDEHDPEAAARLIAEAHRTPRPLARDELLRWLLNVPYQGRPEVRRGRRGPPSRRTQYTDAAAWRRRVLKRYALMASRATVGARTRGIIAEALDNIPATTARHVVTAVAEWIDRRGGPTFDRRTIARHIRALKRR
jgi:hypothetical protein